jgi:soluble lytic murein transglycosylase-like protein
VAAKWIAAAIALLAGAALAKTRSGSEGATASLLSTGESLLTGYDAIYQQQANAFGVDWRLVKAIAQHESAENPDAVNASDPSYGLMQVLCTDDGSGGCANAFNIAGWPPDAGAQGLLDPATNVYYGTQILAANIAAYGVPKGIAVYNSWDQHTAPAAGPFKNQAYVDDVLSKARALGYST